MKIGIPKAMMHYQNPILYEAFFKNLGIEVVYSDDTNKEILEEGKKYSIDETCLSAKIYLGHVANLVKRMKEENIDYIFIPRIGYFNKRETVCVKFYAMYDICKNIFDAKFIDLNIDYSKGITEIKGFLKLGVKLNKRYSEIISSYIRAKNLEKLYKLSKYNKQVKMLENNDSNNMNILIVSHPYVSYDKYIGNPIISYLKNSNVNVYFADINRLSLENSNKRSYDKESYKNISKALYWKYNQDLINGLFEYIDKIDGVIYLSTFPCGPDALVNELVLRKVKNKPSINIIIDEQEAGAGLYTRLESFVDILEQNKMKVVVK